MIDNKNINSLKFLNQRSNSREQALSNLNLSTIQLHPAEVIDVITDANHPLYNGPDSIGRIRANIIYTNELSIQARPIQIYNRSYPLKHEIVLIISLPS